MAQPSECGQQCTTNIVHARTAAQQQSNEGLKPGYPGKGRVERFVIMAYPQNSFGPNASMQEEEQCAANKPFGHCYNQSGWLIPEIYYTHSYI